MRSIICLSALLLTVFAGAPVCLAHPGGGGHSSGSHSSGRSSGRSSSRSSAYHSPGEHYTRGYIRSDGAYVPGHYSTNADGDFYDNWSTKGNVNPHTGKLGDKVTPPASESGEVDYRGTGQEGAGQSYNEAVYQDNRSASPSSRRGWHPLDNLFGHHHAASDKPADAGAPDAGSADVPAVEAGPRLPSITTFPQKVRMESIDGNSYFGDVTAFDGTTYTVKTRYDVVSVNAADVKTLEVQP